MFQLKPDFEDVQNRFEAWWDCQIIDRPLATISFPKDEREQVPLPSSEKFTSLPERWLDTDYQIECAEARLSNTIYTADSLPIAFPNLGPEICAAFYGCKLEYGENTTWSKPILKDWSQASLDSIQLDEDNFYLKKIFEMTDAFIQASAGRYIVGYTDLHGSGDTIAALREPQKLLMDTLEYPNEIRELSSKITDDFLTVYDRFHEMLSTAGMPSTTWTNATCRGKFHVPSNDFSCMISDQSFEELFIPGIVKECQNMDRCIYHLDGPQALRFLDRLLEIPEIQAIQWIPGSPNEDWSKWIEVYQRIQAKGKALQIISVAATDLHRISEVLKPGGIWISNITGISNFQEADAALKILSSWK